MQSSPQPSIISRAAPADSLSKGSKGYNPSLYLVRPTGTQATLCRLPFSPQSSFRVKSSAPPSFSPGQRTIWQLSCMPPSASRYRCLRLSPANLLPIILHRSSGSIVCTEIFMGLMCISSMRSTSLSSIFVRVI